MDPHDNRFKSGDFGNSPDAYTSGLDENPYGMPAETEPEPNRRGDREKQDLADPGTRIIAHLIDQGLPWFVLFAMSFIIAGVQAVAGEDEIYATIAASAWLIFVVAYIIYQLVLLARNGQSLGKRIMKIKVVRLDGKPVDLATLIFVRNFVPNLLGSVTCYIFTFIDCVFLFNPDRGTLHDKMAGTKVVTVQRLRE